jgi:hypothetical protein
MDSLYAQRIELAGFVYIVIVDLFRCTVLGLIAKVINLEQEI